MQSAALLTPVVEISEMGNLADNTFFLFTGGNFQHDVLHNILYDVWVDRTRTTL